MIEAGQTLTVGFGKKCQVRQKNYPPQTIFRLPAVISEPERAKTLVLVSAMLIRHLVVRDIEVG